MMMQRSPCKLRARSRPTMTMGGTDRRFLGHSRSLCLGPVGIGLTDLLRRSGVVVALVSRRRSRCEIRSGPQGCSGHVVARRCLSLYDQSVRKWVGGEGACQSCE
jgi:hypothetical protein